MAGIKQYKQEGLILIVIPSKTEYSEFLAEWQLLLHYHNPTCAYNHPFNLHQKSVRLLQSIFISISQPYSFTKLSLQSPLTLPSSITQQFFISLFLRTTVATMYTKNVFPTSVISPIQAALRGQGSRESFEDWQF